MASGATVGSAIVKLEFDGKEVKASLVNVQKDVEKSAGLLGDKTFKTIQTGAMVAGAAMVAFGKSSLDVGISFDSAMSKVAAISGATGDDLQALRDKAKEMGATTKFSANESAQALTYMAMAGWKTSDMLDGLEGIMNLAAASGEDLATTSDIVTDALTAFGYSASDAGHFADVLAVASSNSNTNVGMMGETFKYVGAAAGALGYSAEDAALAIGLMANAGIKSSQAGTELNAIFTRLSTNTNGAREAIEELGIEFFNSDGSARDFTSVLEELRKATANMTEEEKINFANKVAGQRAQAGLLAMLNASTDDYNKLSGAISNADGTAQKMASTMEDNTGGALTKLKSNFEGLQITIAEKLMPALDPMIEGLSGFVTFLSENTWVIDVIAAGIAGILALGLGMKVAAFIGSFSQMNTLAIGLSVAAAAIAAVATLIIENWDAVSAWFGQFFEFMGQIFGAIGEFVSGIFQNIADFISGIIEFIIGLITGFADFVFGIFQAIGDFIGGIIDFVSGIFQGAFDFISGIFNGIGEVAHNIFQGIGDFIGSIIDNISGVFQGVADFIAGVWNGMKEGASKAWEGIKSIFSTVASFFGSIFSNAWEAVKKVFSVGGKIFDGIKDGIVNAFKTVVNAIINGINKVVKVPFDAINGVLEGLRGIDILGIKPFGWLGTISVPQIPTLATGGYADGATNAIIGEAGKEVVLPLEQNTDNWAGLLASTLSEQMKEQGSSNGDKRPIIINAEINNDMDAYDISRIITEAERRAA